MSVTNNSQLIETPRTTASKPATVPVAPDYIPSELKALNHWVMWRWETRDGKLTKPPYDTQKRYADSSDPRTWTSFDSVSETYNTDEKCFFDGIGFCIRGSGMVGVDFDGVITDGKVEPFVLGILKLLGNPYSEVTPSGNGLRCFIKATLPDGKRKFGAGDRSNKYGAEIYSPEEGGRYLTVTGKKHSGAGIATIENINLAYFLISQICNKRLKSLWMGDMAEYDNDHSKADLALLAILNRLLNGDKLKMEEYFGHSKLAREDKWLGRADYRKMTIEKACSGTAPTPKPEPKAARPLITWNDLLSISEVENTPLEYLVQNFIPKGEITMLSGSFGSFKSYLSYFIADAIGRGVQLAGMTSRQHNVLLLDRENSKATVSLRRYAVGDLENATNVKILGRFTDPTPFELYDARLLHLCEEAKPFVIIDSLADFRDGKKENDAEMQEVMLWAQKLIDVGAVGVLILHHDKKIGGYRGSTSIPAGVGAAFSVKKVGNDGIQVKSFKVRDGEAGTMELKLNFPPSKSRVSYVPDGKIDITVAKPLGSSLSSEPAVEETDMDKKQLVLSVIQKNEGCSRSRAAKESGIRKSDALDFVQELIDEDKIDELNGKLYSAARQEAEYVYGNQ